VIRVEALTKKYSKSQSPALDSASFEVEDGQIVGFVGLNGAGKTTMIRVAVGIALPTSGTVIVDGHDIVKDKVAASRKLGWVPEVPNFEGNAKAASLLQYFAGFHGIPAREAKLRSMELLETVGLSGAEGQKLRAYSQGMKKRFSLASSMLSDPTNYLFDEVLNGLDPEGIRFFRQLMLEFKAKGKAVLLSSHILTEVESIADIVVIIHKGKIMKRLTRSDLSNLGSPGIRLTIRGLDERAKNLLKTYGDLTVDGDSVLLRGTTADTAEINSVLVRMGYSVSEAIQLREGLEEYFLDLVKEKS
jgi:ABC-2 type transport system ATP-binding protein